MLIQFNISFHCQKDRFWAESRLQSRHVKEGQVIGDILELRAAWLPTESSPEHWGGLKEYLVRI